MLVFILFTYHVFSSAATQEGEKRKPVFSTGSDFITVSQTAAFVDKTMLLKNVFDLETIMITAPRRFGKSTNLDMIQTFLSIPIDSQGRQDNKSFDEIRNVFTKLKIFKNERNFFDDNFGKYPVIHVNFKASSKIRSEEDALDIIKDKIHETYKTNQYVCNSRKLTESDKIFCNLWCDTIKYLSLDKKYVRVGLKKLTEYLYNHFDGKKVFILIDEYDAVITRAMFKANRDNLESIIDFVIHMYAELVKENKYVERAVITGISYVAGSGLSGLNNVKIYKFLHQHPMVDFYGFKETEVNQLFKKFNLSSKMIADAHNWYDGYICRMGNRIYNPFSLLNFFQDGLIQSYWRNSGSVEALDNAFRYPSIKQSILKMIKNESIEIEFFDDISLKEIVLLHQINEDDLNLSDDFRDLFFSFLFEQGYLTFNGPTDLGIKIPNMEVKTVFSKKLKTYVAKEYKVNSEQLQKCTNFFDHLNPRAQSMDACFIEKVNNFHKDLTGLFKTLKEKSRNEIVTNEAVFEHDIFTVLLFTSNFHIPDSQIYNKYINGTRDRKSPRLDLYMTKGDFAVIIELKHSKQQDPNSVIALEQILVREYYTVFDVKEITPQEINHYLFVGISINYNASISISCLLNSKIKAEAVTVPQTSTSSHLG